MHINKAKPIIGQVLLLGIPLLFLAVFNIGYAAIDSILVPLIIQGFFFPPNDSFYLLNSDIHRFLYAPLRNLYNWFPGHDWFKISLLIPQAIVFASLMLIGYRQLTRKLNLNGITAFVLVATTSIVCMESTLVIDPFTAALFVPSLALLLPWQSVSQPWKTILALALGCLLLYCMQMRLHGVLMGTIPIAVVLGLTNSKSATQLVARYCLPLLVGLMAGIGFALGITLQQNEKGNATVKELADIDAYVYTIAPLNYVRTEAVDNQSTTDSLKILAYSTFYFPETIDVVKQDVAKLSYPSVLDAPVFDFLPIKWHLFWERATILDNLWYLSYSRFLWYLLATSVLLLLWIVALGATKEWVAIGVVWILFAFGYFVSIGVVLTMPYKVASPLFAVLFIGFVILGIKTWQHRSGKRPTWLLYTIFTALCAMALLQVYTYGHIQNERQQANGISQAAVAEMNGLFAGKTVVFDLFSLVLLEEANLQTFKPNPIVFGDYYLSLLPEGAQHLQEQLGTNTFAGVFTYFAEHPDTVILAMSAHRVSLIQAYLKHIKGLDLEFVPLEGDYAIEKLDYHYYEVPLLLNYYTVRYPQTAH